MRRFAKVVGYSAWVLFVFVWVASVYGLAATYIPGVEMFTQSTQGQLWANALIYVFILLLVLMPFGLKHGARPVARLLGVDKRPSRDIWWLPIVTWFIYMFVTSFVMVLVSALLPWIDRSQAQDVGFDNLMYGYEYVLAFIALVVLPPVAEELVFRGYLYGRLRTLVGFIPTALVVSVLFGFVHGQWNVGIDTAVLSMFLCYLREKTGTIWASMAVHAIKNGIAYFFLFIAPLLGYNLIQ